MHEALKTLSHSLRDSLSGHAQRLLKKILRHTYRDLSELLCRDLSHIVSVY